ncbi:hypothetical protein CC1G_03232 [Coprinopsis cinerea okayama7|uniref:CUE domain-containing protein n=1 Tax=Coprinopsis cinerea (strain Okayama-7 / 130 / ATCC MYA-4618 / FGSC 9003) TaxID=240176 RepID=A8N789_COPC7|nr:hypothetical protein CC1G_03232 [Coprinopsis cinerea okayama7\|eukprot:XP_001830695.2 hypothetical protein CC1G_03232 [Coprinopsis cinerea okayama7\
MSEPAKPAASSPVQSPPEVATTTPTNSPPEASRSSPNPFLDNEVVEEPREHASPPPSVNTVTRPTSQPSPDTTENVTTDPAIAELKAMFPDYDDIILQSVLESANGNQAAAIEILLGMSDPNYKSEAPPPQAAMSQTELDEQLARRLMLEEQQQLQWSPNAAPGLGPQRRNSRYGQPQVGSPAVAPHSAGATSGDKDTMAELQEQFTKVAEAGKKTFGNIFTKVKAKIQEFERGGLVVKVGFWSIDTQTPYAQYHGSGAHGQQQAASYYDPNSPITLSSSQATPPQGTPAPAVQGYDATPSAASPPPAAARAASPPVTQTATPSASTVPPPNPAAVPLDGGKLGLLPKRPVSLIRDPPSGQQQKRADDSDDDLEYAENPFEDQKK